MKTKQNEKREEIQTKTGNDLTLTNQPKLNGPFTLMRHFAEDMEAMLSDFGLHSEFPSFSMFENDPFFGRNEFLSNW